MISNKNDGSKVITLDTYRQLALSLPGSEEQAHFEKPSFRANKKIFATYHLKEHRAMLKLSLNDQSVFCAFDQAVFFPVPGAWGKQRATFVNLSTVRKDMFTDALTTAYEGVMKAKKKK